MSVVTKGKVKDTIQKYVLINELIFVAHGSSLEWAEDPSLCFWQSVRCYIYFDVSNLLLSDFDFGVELLRQMAKQCNFPWLMSNVDDQERNAPLAGGNLFHSKNILGYIWSIFAGEKSLLLEWQGVKVGLIGLVEEEWLHTLSNMPKNILFHDFVTEGQRLTDELRYCLFILLFFYVCK